MQNCNFCFFTCIVLAVHWHSFPLKGTCIIVAVVDGVVTAAHCLHVVVVIVCGAVKSDVWDIDNPDEITLSTFSPDEVDVHCMTHVKDRLWVGAGESIFFLNAENPSISEVSLISLLEDFKTRTGHGIYFFAFIISCSGILLWVVLL